MFYVADGENGFMILNASGPNSRTLIGKYDTAGTVNFTMVEGSTAYIVDSVEGLVTLDITNPASPTLLASNTSLRNTDKLIINGNLAFLANQDYGMLILDISNPSSIQHVAVFNTTSNNKVTDIDYKDDIAYVSVENQGLYLVNVTTPTSLEIVSTISNGYTKSMNVVVENDLVHIVNGFNVNDSMIQTYNITNTSNPVNLNYTENFTGFAQDIEVINSTLLIAAGDAGLVFVNITNTSNVQIYHTYNSLGYCADVEIYGAYVFITDGYRGLDYMLLSAPKETPEAASTSSKKTISFGWTWGGLALATIPILALLTKKSLKK